MALVLRRCARSVLVVTEGRGSISHRRNRHKPSLRSQAPSGHVPKGARVERVSGAVRSRKMTGADGRGFGASAAREAAPLTTAAPSRKPKLRPLLALWPYVARYRGYLVGACAALVVASLATLAVPVAVRRMIDFGFSAERLGLIDQYFAVMIAVVGVLA